MRCGRISNFEFRISNEELAVCGIRNSSFEIRNSKFSLWIASTHRSTGSASITIPGPPPYASSSVERCLSDAKSRRTHTRVSSSPCFTPRPMMPSASSGSNMLGKMVTKSNLIETFRQVDDDTLLTEVDVGADLRDERHIVAAA